MSTHTTSPTTQPLSPTQSALANALAAQNSNTPTEPPATDLQESNQADAPDTPPVAEQPAESWRNGSELQVGDYVALPGGNLFMFTADKLLHLVSGPSLQKTLAVQASQTYELVAPAEPVHANTVVKGSTSTGSLRAEVKEPAARAAFPEFNIPRGGKQ